MQHRGPLPLPEHVGCYRTSMFAAPSFDIASWLEEQNSICELSDSDPAQFAHHGAVHLEIPHTLYQCSGLGIIGPSCSWLTTAGQAKV